MRVEELIIDEFKNSDDKVYHRKYTVWNKSHEHMQQTQNIMYHVKFISKNLLFFFWYIA